MRQLIAELLLELGTRLVRAALERLGYGYVVVKSAAYEVAEQKARDELEERMRKTREGFDRFVASAKDMEHRQALRAQQDVLERRQQHENALRSAIKTLTRPKTWN